MACGCGGSSNVYKPVSDTRKAASPATPNVGNGFPAVWNGPQPKK